MTHYTVGFLFNKDISKVLLIHKLTPLWQRGKVNGVGGKFEEGETNLECIVREVEEEAGLVTKTVDWLKVGELHSSTFDVDVMTMIYTGDEQDAMSKEEQQIEWYSVYELPTNIISNLSWLIPLCKDALLTKQFDVVSVNYKF